MEEEKIIEIIEQLRPFLINDGGDVEFIKYENNIVYIKMKGACSHCLYHDITINEGLKAAIISEVPQVIDVINVD